jgi:hypothetical protein
MMGLQAAADAYAEVRKRQREHVRERTAGQELER